MVDLPQCTTLDTLGWRFHPGIIFRFRHIAPETFEAVPEVEGRYRLVLVERGAGILNLAGKRCPFIAPALFCLNERDVPVLEQSHDLEARSLVFDPCLVNSAFTPENLRDPSSVFEGTAFQDVELLRAFFHRDEGYYGQIHIPPPVARHIASRFDAVEDELVNQSTLYWPCRSRSFFLEIAVILFRLFSSPQENDLPEEVLLDSAPEVDPVILHLYTHYHEKLTVDALSRAFHTNRTTLEQRFHQATGVSVITYLTRLRIRVAATLLHDTKIPVAEVADRVGFKDKTHFGRTFRKLMGCSPAEYRQRYCWMLN